MKVNLTVKDARPVESTCERCGGPNPIAWHAPSPLWNAVMRRHPSGGELYGFCCPTCFVIVATEAGFDTAHWHLGIDGRDFAGEVSPDGRVWDAKTCLWVAPVLSPTEAGPQDIQQRKNHYGGVISQYLNRAGEPTATMLRAAISDLIDVYVEEARRGR